MGTKSVQLANGGIIGTDDIHLEELVRVDEDVPTSYVQKWDISEGANDRVTAYLTGTSSEYSLHVYGSGRMKDYTYTANRAYPYLTVPWASYVFYNRSTSDSRIKNVYIHNGVQNIGSYFLCGEKMKSSYKSTSLNTLSIADTVREIGSYAFCSNIPRQIVISPGVRRIWNSAFAAAWDVDNKIVDSPITCPESVNHIDSTAFLNTSWWGNATDTFCFLGNNCLVKYNGTGGTITVPDGTRSLTFWNTPADVKQSVTSVSLPDSLRILGTSAFNSFSALTSVSLPDSVRYIATNSFKSCSNLLSAQLPRGLKYIGANSFYGCSKLQHIYIPASVREILSTALEADGGVCAASQSPFYGCSNVKIYCEAAEKPEGFDTYWNYISNSATATVYWNVTRAEYEQATGGD